LSAQVLHEILTDLAIGDFAIKLNHRCLLDGIMAIAGVPPHQFRPICSAIDKLDKEPWDEVRREMVEDKGLAGAVADRIGGYVALKGAPKKMLEELRGKKEVVGHEGARAAVEDLGVLFGLLEAMGGLDRVSLDLSLARGLDYYTGVIYEAVLTLGGERVGSIAAGGRCDARSLSAFPSTRFLPACDLIDHTNGARCLTKRRLSYPAAEPGGTTQ
jgi:histidyl-tRNA synthetase